MPMNINIRDLIPKKYKNYSWDKNAGYGTSEHLKAIKKFGITLIFQMINNIRNV